MFTGYAQNNITYRFFMLKSDEFDYNTIIETKNAEFFEPIFLPSNKASHAHVETVVEDFNEELRRSKRPRKKFFL